MTTTHTPGPWAATGYHVEARAGAIATVCDAGDGDTEGDANARLIAAAPDLLAAAIDALETFERRFPDSPTAHDLRAAIARATGADA